MLELIGLAAVAWLIGHQMTRNNELIEAARAAQNLPNDGISLSDRLFRNDKAETLNGINSAYTIKSLEDRGLILGHYATETGKLPHTYKFNSYFNPLYWANKPQELGVFQYKRMG